MSELDRLSGYFTDNLSTIIDQIRQITTLESPSGDPHGINNALSFLCSLFRSEVDVKLIPTEVGSICRAIFPGQSTQRILILAHIDTVYPIGAWQTLWRIEGDKAMAPGIYDMKGGVIQAVWALQAFRDLQVELPYTIELLVTPDEEVGSSVSRHIIEKAAHGAKAVLVVEPPSGDGGLKIARKGVGDITVTIEGKAAHQGSEPEKGRNAVVSAAHLVLELMKIQDLERGTILGPNIISGGTATNVVADRAKVQIDLRVWSLEEADRALKDLHSIRPLPGTTYHFSGGVNRPPLEPTVESERLFSLACNIGAKLGLVLTPARVGGGSDGNFTGKIAPTLDGFGVMGGGAHQRDLEYIVVSEIPKRAALLHEVIRTL